MRKLILIISILQSFGLVNAQTPADVKKILKVTDTVGLKTLSVKLKNNDFDRKKRVANYLAKQAIKKPPFIIKKSSTLNPGQIYDIRNGVPIYRSTQNSNGNTATRASYLKTSGGLGLDLNGENMNVYVWDGGPTLPTHQEFGNRVTIGDGNTVVPSPPTTLYTTAEQAQNESVQNSQHANHVTGTLVASGIDANSRGMAPLAHAITNYWDNDITEMTTAAYNGMILSNHSYGYPAWVYILYQLFGYTGEGNFLGAYNVDSYFLDKLLFSAPKYLSVWAAGNDGNMAPDDVNFSPAYDYDTWTGLLLPGYDKLSREKTAKNNLVVASIDQPIIDITGNVTGANVSSFSSQGPTDDLRIKPDIAGMGNPLYSTGNILSSESVPNPALTANTYGSMPGTSMASPNVTGTLLLLQQHYKNLYNEFMFAATLKGLALHTADDIETTGPDAKTGWGLLNAKRAANVISDNGQFSIIKELPLSQGGSYSFTVESDNINSLIASISWTDPAKVIEYVTDEDGAIYDKYYPGLNDPTPVLVNDLDIRVTKNGTTYFPYRLTSASTNTQADNTVDPFERVDIANATGSYTITVTHKGTLTNGSQNYSLIVSGVRNCISDRTITGSYSTYKTNSGTWIKSSGTTTVVGDKKVILDANPNTGYVLLTPGFHAVPSNLGSFVARVVDGCNPYNYRLKSAVISESFDQANSYEDSTIFGIQIENDLFTISPNPANDNIRLTSSKTIMSLSIYNSFGLIVYSDNAVNETELSINISSFAPGIYFLHCDIDGKDIVKSIVKE